MPSTTPEPLPRVANVRLRGDTERLAARAYWPGRAVRAPPALVVYLHTADPGRTPERLCARAGVVVLAVRLGSDPAEGDAFAAVAWAAGHADELDADPTRVFVTGAPATEVVELVRASGWPHVTELPGDGPEQLVIEIRRRTA
jgi:acetyl esterase